MLKGRHTAVIQGVTPQEVFDFVLDPAQYRKADTKIIWVTKLGDTPDGMIAREDGKFLGRFPGSVITRYHWEPPGVIDVRLEYGFPKSMHAWFEIEQVEGGTRMMHAEEMEMGKGPLGWLLEQTASRWWPQAVIKEVNEIKRLMEAGERGRGVEAAGEPQQQKAG